jgi:hypothetical protein
MAGVGQQALAQAMVDALAALDERQSGYSEAVGTAIVKMISEQTLHGTETAQRQSISSQISALVDAFPRLRGQE